MAEKAGEGLQGCISCFPQETFRLRNVGVPRPSGFGDAGIGGHKKGTFASQRCLSASFVLHGSFRFPATCF